MRSRIFLISACLVCLTSGMLGYRAISERYRFSGDIETPFGTFSFEGEHPETQLDICKVQ